MAKAERSESSFGIVESERIYLPKNSDENKSFSVYRIYGNCLEDIENGVAWLKSKGKIIKQPLIHTPLSRLHRPIEEIETEFEQEAGKDYSTSMQLTGEIDILKISGKFIEKPNNN